MNHDYLMSDHGFDRICDGCATAVKENPATGRWFITMGHPGFNSPANNRDGYATKRAAEKALAMYANR